MTTGFLNEEYIQHLKDIDIPAWQFGKGDWFTIHLFRLFAKADETNTFKLASVFPEEYAAFAWWQSGAWEESRKDHE
jgi:hypothetical protein